MDRLDSNRIDSKNRRRSVSLSGKFIKSKSNVQHLGQGEIDCGARLRKVVARVLKSKYCSNFMVALVLFDAYCTCADIDSRAAGIDTPYVFQFFSDLCLSLYTLELILNIIVKGRAIVKDWTLMLDVVIIVCGYADVFLNIIADSDFVVRIGIFRAFRLARIVRLMRLLRKTRALRELQKLVTMMATCLKALVWSSVFCFLIMSVWAMFMVEVVHPIITSMQNEHGVFDDCTQCVRAAGSVMDANLLLFKTVIAGDSWGLIAVPVIEEHPATAFIFIGSQVTLVFGVLNLIVAVVVDNFAEARQRDILNLAEELEYDFEKDQKFLQKVFDRMDADGSGLVTFEELVDGARRDPEFQSRLRVMDIDETDLKQLFEMIDTNEQGYINATEFIAPLSRWVHDSKTAPRFIKYNLQRTMNQQEELYVYCQDAFNSMVDRLDDLADRLASTNLQDIEDNLMAATESCTHVERSSSHASSVERRSTAGSLASDGSQLDLRTVDPDGEGVEQPHRSKKVKVTEPEGDDLTAAMDRLELFVLTATESALKKSMAIMGSTIRQRLSGEIVDGKMNPRERTRGEREPPRRRMGNTKHATKSSFGSGVNSSTSSWALGKSLSVNSQAGRFSGSRNPSKEQSRPRLPIGTFSPPKSVPPMRASSQDIKDPLSKAMGSKKVAKIRKPDGVPIPTEASFLRSQSF